MVKRLLYPCECVVNALFYVTSCDSYINKPFPWIKCFENGINVNKEIVVNGFKGKLFLKHSLCTEEK